jgi:hypothetical protein
VPCSELPESSLLGDGEPGALPHAGRALAGSARLEMGYMNAHVIELVVRGRLSPELIIALEGFLVETDGDGMTRVIGPVVDQARLLGLLDMFDDLHIEVVSMNPVDAGTRPWGTTGIP